jgi:hypothetical protein
VDLKAFVAETLKQIIAGIEEAQQNGIGINSASTQNVDFDVAVTATEGTDKKGGVGVFVLGFGLGAQGATSVSNSSVSRIRFTVPIFYPDRKK